jgi:hypothetical protein
MIWNSGSPTTGTNGVVKVKCCCGKWVKNATMYVDGPAFKVRVEGCCYP